MKRTNLNVNPNKTIVTESTKRYDKILKVYKNSKMPLTDREVKDILGFSDMNMVRPSITRMVSRGVITESGTIICKKTGKLVRCCEVA